MAKKRGKKEFKRFSIKINLTNRWLYTFIAIGILAIIGTGVYAWANAAGVGHDLSEIEPCADGQILKVSGGAWTCGTAADTNAGTICDGANQFLAGDGTCKTGYLDADGVDTGISSCSIHTCALQNYYNTCTVNCPAGTFATGGGVHYVVVDGFFPNYPVGNGWRCTSRYSGTCYVRCCQ